MNLHQTITALLAALPASAPVVTSIGNTVVPEYTCSVGMARTGLARPFEALFFDHGGPEPAVAVAAETRALDTNGEILPPGVEGRPALVIFAQVPGQAS